MGHVTTILFTLSLAIAAVTLVINIALYKKAKQKFHKYFILFISSLFIGLAFDLLYNYYGTNIRTDVSFQTDKIILLLDRFTGSVVVGLEYYFSTVFALYLYKFNISKKSKSEIIEHRISFDNIFFTDFDT